jgi:hypothetical protein
LPQKDENKGLEWLGEEQRNTPEEDLGNDNE